MQTPLESTVVKTILNGLRSYGAKAIKIHVDGYVEEGTPDIFACLNGWMFAIEVKRPDDKEHPTKKQQYELAAWEEAGAVVGVARGWPDVERLIRPALRSPRVIRESPGPIYGAVEIPPISQCPTERLP